MQYRISSKKMLSSNFLDDDGVANWSCSVLNTTFNFNTFMPNPVLNGKVSAGYLEINVDHLQASIEKRIPNSSDKKESLVN